MGDVCYHLFLLIKSVTAHPFHTNYPPKSLTAALCEEQSFSARQIWKEGHNLVQAVITIVPRSDTRMSQSWDFLPEICLFHDPHPLTLAKLSSDKYSKMSSCVTFTCRNDGGLSNPVFQLSSWGWRRSGQGQYRKGKIWGLAAFVLFSFLLLWQNPEIINL